MESLGWVGCLGWILIHSVLFIFSFIGWYLGWLVRRAGMHARVRACGCVGVGRAQGPLIILISTAQITQIPRGLCLLDN